MRNMKTLSVICVICFSIAPTLAFDQPIISNTKATCTIGDRTGDCCVWEDVKLFPGQELNHLGKCEELYCEEDFSIIVTPCPFDMYGEYEWIDQDDSKPYPECCGQKTKIKN